MNKKVIVSILLLAAAGALFLLLADFGKRVEPSEPAGGEQPIVGGDRDTHDCIGSAGYSWCEAKSACLRPFEEFCPDDAAELADAIGETSGVAFAYVGETTFDWIVSDGETSADMSIDGVRYSAEGVSAADYDAVEAYMNGNHEVDAYNLADGVEGGLRGYRVGYMACALDFRRASDDQPLLVSLDCGYFNPNDVPGIIVGRLIGEDLAEKYGKAIDEVSVTVSRMDETHAAGGVMFGAGGPGEGGGVLAVKLDGEWQVVYDGNGSVDCGMMRADYGFSDEILQPEFCD